MYIYIYIYIYVYIYKYMYTYQGGGTPTKLSTLKSYPRLSRYFIKTLRDRQCRKVALCFDMSNVDG